MFRFTRRSIQECMLFILFSSLAFQWAAISYGKENSTENPIDQLIEARESLQKRDTKTAQNLLQSLQSSALPQPLPTIHGDLAEIALALEQPKNADDFRELLKKYRLDDLLPQRRKETEETAPSRKKEEKQRKQMSKFQRLREAWKSGDTGAALKIAKSVKKSVHLPACEPLYLYSLFVQGRAARSNQDRPSFFKYQSRLGEELAKDRCLAKHFEMSDSEYLTFWLSEINWSARVNWEFGHIETAKRHAELAYEKALQTERESEVLESLNILIGRISYEVDRPEQSLKRINQINQEVEERFPNGSKREQLTRWLRRKEVLFHFMARDYTRCAEVGYPLTKELQSQTGSWSGRRETAEAAYWTAKCLALSQERPDEPRMIQLLELISIYSPTGYYAMRVEQDPYLSALMQKVPQIHREIQPAPWDGFRERPRAEIENQIATLAQLNSAIQGSKKFATADRKSEPIVGLILRSLTTINGTEHELFLQAPELFRSMLQGFMTHRDYSHVILSAGRAARFLRLDHPQNRELLEFLYPPAFEEEFKKAGQLCKIDPKLLYAVSRQESLFVPDAVSHVGAQGVMQVMPFVWRQEVRKQGLDGVASSPLDPKWNIQVGACHLKESLSKYQGNLVFSLAAYNAGQSAADSWIKRRFRGNEEIFIEFIPYEETQTYVKRILRSLHQQKKLDS